MAARRQSKVRGALDELLWIARVAEGMLDGDLAARILTDLAAHHIAHPHPAHRHMAGDYYDVDHAAFLRTKKTLLRLERLAAVECNTTLWMRVRGAPELVTAAVQNGRLHRYYRFGENGRKPEGEMAACLAGGCRVAVRPRPRDDFLTVLAPVRDSLGVVVGCVEITAVHPASRRLAPAWS